MVTLGWVLIGFTVGLWVALMWMRYDEARRWWAIAALLAACCLAVVLIGTSVAR